MLFPNFNKRKSYPNSQEVLRPLREKHHKLYDVAHLHELIESALGSAGAASKDAKVSKEIRLRFVVDGAQRI